jgi:hypothetical protein
MLETIRAIGIFAPFVVLIVLEPLIGNLKLRQLKQHDKFAGWANYPPTGTT